MTANSTTDRFSGLREHLLPVWAAVQLSAGAAAIAWPMLNATPRAAIFSLVGGFLILHAALILLASFGELAIARSVMRKATSHVVQSGVGFYGLVTLSRFLHLEIADIVDMLQDGWPATVGELVKDWLMGFSIDSLMNSIEAFQWPWKLLLPAGHTWAIGALLLCYLPYRLANQVIPDLKVLVNAESDDEEGEGDSDDDKVSGSK